MVLLVSSDIRVKYNTFLYCSSNNVRMFRSLETGKVKRMFLTQCILIRPGRVELEGR